MEIRDNGLGLFAGAAMLLPEGVGLRNTRARLQQLYNRRSSPDPGRRARGRLQRQHPHSLPEYIEEEITSRCPYECCLAMMKSLARERLRSLLKEEADLGDRSRMRRRENGDLH